MEIIAQLGLIIGVGYAGELLARFLPVRLPAGVLGIILVFAALSLRLVKPRYFGKTADFISAQMGFFFLPLSVSVLQNYQAISPVLFQIIAVCAISTIITFAASYGAVRLLRVAMARGERLLSRRGIRPRSVTLPPPREAPPEKTAGPGEPPPAQDGKARG